MKQHDGGGLQMKAESIHVAVNTANRTCGGFDRLICQFCSLVVEQHTVQTFCFYQLLFLVNPHSAVFKSNGAMPQIFSRLVLQKKKLQSGDVFQVAQNCECYLWKAWVPVKSRPKRVLEVCYQIASRFYPLTNMWSVSDLSYATGRIRAAGGNDLTFQATLYLCTQAGPRIKQWQGQAEEKFHFSPCHWPPLHPFPSWGPLHLLIASEDCTITFRSHLYCCPACLLLHSAPMLCCTGGKEQIRMLFHFHFQDLDSFHGF